MEDKVKQIMAVALEVSADEIDDDSSPDTIETWDSLRHMNLVLALEEEFGVQFEAEQVVEMLNFRLIILTLQELLGR